MPHAVIKFKLSFILEAITIGEKTDCSRMQLNFLPLPQDSWEVNGSVSEIISGDTFRGIMRNSHGASRGELA